MVLDRDLGEDLGGRGLGVRDVDRPVASMIEYAGVHELELRFVARTSAVLIDQPLIGKRLLWVVIPPAQPSVAGQSVEAPPVLLDILTVVSLRTGQAEHALLQDRIDTVPQGQGKAEFVVDVRQTCHAVFVPPVRARSRMIMWKVIPSITVVAVVLTNGAPSPLGQIRPPLVPRVRFGEAVFKPSGG